MNREDSKRWINNNTKREKKKTNKLKRGGKLTTTETDPNSNDFSIGIYDRNPVDALLDHRGGGGVHQNGYGGLHCDWIYLSWNGSDLICGAVLAGCASSPGKTGTGCDHCEKDSHHRQLASLESSSSEKHKNWYHWHKENWLKSTELPKHL